MSTIEKVKIFLNSCSQKANIYYVDSDGVIADFVSWAKKKMPEIIDIDGNTKPDCVDKLHLMMIENYRECYRNFDVLECGDFFLDKIRNLDNWFVLTATLSLEKIEATIGKSKKAMEVYNAFCENKYYWYESHGIKKDKVIITGHRHDKQRYATKQSVLFDDFIDNITDWQNAGGIAFRIGNRIR